MSNCNTVNAFAAFSPPQLQIPDFFGVVTKKGTLSYTHLEGNGQIWQVSSSNQKVSVVIDPLASQLDFGKCTVFVYSVDIMMYFAYPAILQLYPRDSMGLSSKQIGSFRVCYN